MITINSYWFGRFKVSSSNCNLVFKDSLSNGSRKILAQNFDGLAGNDLVKAYFEKGFLASVIDLSPFKIDNHSNHSNSFFWQFPCATERVAYINHIYLNSPKVVDNIFHLYLGLPWATFIDKKIFPEDILKSVKVKISGIRHALAEFGFELKIHTVCQHVYWKECIDTWINLGVDDIWLSHATENLTSKNFSIHPWPLFAVNIEDLDRNIGISIGKPAPEKKYLASFIGAFIDHYLTNDRLKLMNFSKEPDFYIKVLDKWHFEDIVYKHQVNNEDLDLCYKIDETVKTYNQVMSDSIFALCPSGAGPNSLRLWEALAVGVIPVLIGSIPAMPKGGSLSKIDWNEIILTISDSDLSNLPNFLRSIDIEEINKRQKLAIEAYNLVKKQTCF
jgi:Exostosin family